MDLNEDLYCVGCGAKLQTEKESEPGYVPKASLEKNIESGTELYCKRCFRLRNYNEITPVNIEDSAFTDILNKISDENALVVYLVDIFDFNGSIISGIKRYIGDNPMIVVGNKEDLIPKSVNREKLLKWLNNSVKNNGLNPVSEILISAKKKTNVDELLKEIEKYRKGKNVYIVGTANVGKSTLINSIIKNSSNIQNLVTTSRFPGTTLDRIEIPLEDGSYLIDTPGVIQNTQLTHYVSPKDLKEVVPTTEIKPRVYQLRGKQTIFIGGLARIDLIDPERSNFIFYMSNRIELHRTKTENADQFREKHLGEILTPPTENIEEFRELNSKKIVSKNEKTDVVLSGLGWITIDPNTTVKVYVPKGVEITTRRAVV